MQRPYIFCHMLTSLDGKLTGPYMQAKAIAGASDEYERINASYRPQAWLCGRVTTDENFTFYRKPALDERATAVPEGDYVAVADAPMYSVDLYGTAVLLEEFGNVIARGGAGVVIASQSGHRLGVLTAEQDKALATTPADALLSLPMLQPDQVKDSLHAYQLAKRCKSLRVMAEAVRWGKRGARVNTISPGIIITPLAHDELTGPRGAGYRNMIEKCPVGRAGTPDEVGTLGALLTGPDGAFITGSDFLMDGGVTASYWFGELAPN